MEDFNNLPDFQAMFRVLNHNQASFNQKYYTFMATQQKMASSGSAPNGTMPAGDQMGAGYMMGGQMMSPMGYMNAFPDPTQNNVNNSTQQ